jgi:hypothetical protein
LPEGTLSSRLATARKTLAARLSGYGATVSAATLVGLLARNARAACIHGPLVVSTVRAAGGAVPACVAALTEGVMKSMLLTKLKAMVWGLLLAASVGVGAAALTYRSEAGEPAQTSNHPPAAARPTADRDDLEALRLEVEALRLELKATKGRVQALEETAQARQPERAKLAPYDLITNQLIDLRDRPWYVPPGNNVIHYLPKDSTLGNVYDVILTNPPIPSSPEEVRKAADDIEAAAKKLREHPDDKEAVEALEKAVQRLKQGAAVKPPGD